MPKKLVTIESTVGSHMNQEGVKLVAQAVQEVGE